MSSMERTLVVLKPDAVERGIVGDVLTRFERSGLKIAGLKMFVPDKELGNKHYPKDRREFVEGLGKRTLSSYGENDLDVKKQFGDKDAHGIGLEVQKWLVDFLSSGPVVAIVLESPHAISVARKIVGHTIPAEAAPGTIRGDYSFDSPYFANKSNRTIRNLIHASGNKEEAEFEIGLWFGADEIFDYRQIHNAHMSR